MSVLPSALQAQAMRYYESNRLPQAAEVLEQLLANEPFEASHYLLLAQVVERLGSPADVSKVFARMVTALPQHAVAHFNHACSLRRIGQLEAALAAHRRALALGINQAEEVWSNIGVILGSLHRQQEARAAFGEALAQNDRWLPALYNFALLHEEQGDRPAALALFQRILQLEPNYHDAQIRIAHLNRASDPQDPQISTLALLLQRPQLPPLTRESLHFAIAKLLDDCGQYKEAFAHYRAGNELSRSRVKPYLRHASEEIFARVRSSFSASWLANITPVSQQPLVFICGMYRSGSTLLEQMLATHPDITAGGELNWFNARLASNSPDWPQSLTGADSAPLSALGKGYLEYLAQRFPGAAMVTDKQPGNFMYLGVLKALFPNLRVLHTVRDGRDVCLSIYFQQFNDSLGYACDLADTAHYLGQYQQLMRHWQTLMPASILSVDYARLVTNPAVEMQKVCAFLGLEWHREMLDFMHTPTRVRSASVWQVREPLYTRSLERWRHYADELGTVSELGTGDIANDH